MIRRGPLKGWDGYAAYYMILSAIMALLTIGMIIATVVVAMKGGPQ